MKWPVVVLLLLILGGCDDNNTYTLYRNTPGFPDNRIHVATFDTTDGSSNRENCDRVGDLFAKQPDVTVRYWCEKGRYRK